MESSTTTNDSSENNYYYPDGMMPVTPQARQYGYPMDVYVTQKVWDNYCVWPGGYGISTEARLIALLNSCFIGLGKALSVADDMLSFKFKHFFVDAGRPRAKKKAKARLGARLLLHPDTSEPWLLLFNPNYDDTSQLKQGEAPDGATEEDRSTGGDSGKDGDSDGAGLDSEGSL